MALVTGSGRRLGKKIAIQLAAAGYDVCVHYNTSKKGAETALREVKQNGARGISLKADLRRQSQVVALFKRTAAHFGRLDLLVNNAAILPRSTDVLKITERQWNDVLSTNLTASFFCAQEAARIMSKQESGHIINIASIGGLQSWKSYLAYNVSKAGVIMMTKTMAKALAPHVRVNAIAPGTIIIPGEETTASHQPPVDRIPLKKYGRPSDIAEAVAYLAQTHYVTGQVLAVDGGISIP